MFEYFEKMGLESNTNTDPVKELDELELEIIGCESAADLAISLLDFSLESEITSIGFNKVLVAETVAAGMEGDDQLGDLLSQLGMSRILEDGTEGVKEKAKAGWYKVKSVATAVVNAVIAFFKKIATLWATTDKMYTKINKKAGEVSTKWGKHTFPASSEKKVESATKNLNANIKTIQEKIGGTAATAIISKFVDISSKDLSGFIKLIESGAGLTEAENTAIDKKADKEASKNVKDAASELVKESKVKEEMDFATFKSNSKSLLDTIESSSKDLMDAKLFEKCKNAVTAMEKIKKEISGIKGEDIDKILSGEENKQKLMQSAAKHIHVFNQYPKNMATKAKAYATMCSAGFSEISKCMSISK